MQNKLKTSANISGGSSIMRHDQSGNVRHSSTISIPSNHATMTNNQFESQKALVGTKNDSDDEPSLLKVEDGENYHKECDETASDENSDCDSEASDDSVIQMSLQQYANKKMLSQSASSTTRDILQIELSNDAFVPTSTSKQDDTTKAIIANTKTITSMINDIPILGLSLTTHEVWTWEKEIRRFTKYTGLRIVKSKLFLSCDLQMMLESYLECVLEADQMDPTGFFTDVDAAIWEEWPLDVLLKGVYAHCARNEAPSYGLVFKPNSPTRINYDLIIHTTIADFIFPAEYYGKNYECCFQYFHDLSEFQEKCMYGLLRLNLSKWKEVLKKLILQICKYPEDKSIKHPLFVLANDLWRQVDTISNMEEYETAVEKATMKILRTFMDANAMGWIDETIEKHRRLPEYAQPFATKQLYSYRMHNNNNNKGKNAHHDETRNPHQPAATQRKPPQQPVVVHKEHAYCQVCGNTHTISLPCALLDHPDCNHDYETIPWHHSQAGRTWLKAGFTALQPRQRIDGTAYMCASYEAMKVSMKSKREEGRKKKYEVMQHRQQTMQLNKGRTKRGAQFAGRGSYNDSNNNKKRTSTHSSNSGNNNKRPRLVHHDNSHIQVHRDVTTAVVEKEEEMIFYNNNNHSNEYDNEYDDNVIVPCFSPIVYSDDDDNDNHKTNERNHYKPTPVPIATATVTSSSSSKSVLKKTSSLPVPVPVSDTSHQQMTTATATRTRRLLWKDESKEPLTTIHLI